MAADVATDRRRLGRVGLYAALFALALVVLFPLYLAVVRALSNPSEYQHAGRPLFPVAIEWDVFQRAFTESGLGRAMVVSLIAGALTLACQLVTSTLAAYAFVFLRFPFQRLAFALCVATMFLPIEVTLLANVHTIRQLQWTDTYPALVLPFAATGFGIFLLRQGCAGIPTEIRDAARIDGYGHLRFLVQFAVPLTRPVVAAFLLISALSVWGGYLWPRMIIDDPDFRTVPLALAGLVGTTPERANVAMAGSLIALLPIAVLLVIFQRQLVRGLTAGATKG
jgi:sn-glycerol 3-phosphate transport system permease protein